MSAQPPRLSTPDYYFVISGNSREWKIWREAFMTCCDMEGRLDRTFRSSHEFRVLIRPHNKWVLYRSLLPGGIDAVRGIGPFAVLAIGAYQTRWPEQDLDMLTRLSLESIRHG